MKTDFKPHVARIVFRGKQYPNGPWSFDGKGNRVCVSTIAYTGIRGAVFGSTPGEIAAAIKEQYPDVYEYEIVGLDNQRLDYEMVYGMVKTNYKFADSIYA